MVSIVSKISINSVIEVLIFTRIFLEGAILGSSMITDIVHLNGDLDLNRRRTSFVLNNSAIAFKVKFGFTLNS